MYKLIAIYSTPENPEAFLSHYRETHLPLVAQIPGLMTAEISQTRATILGDADVFLIAEMSFADKAAFDAAMASAENRAAGKDLMSFAKGKVTLLEADTNNS